MKGVYKEGKVLSKKVIGWRRFSGKANKMESLQFRNNVILERRTQKGGKWELENPQRRDFRKESKQELQNSEGRDFRKREKYELGNLERRKMARENQDGRNLQKNKNQKVGIWKGQENRKRKIRT